MSEWEACLSDARSAGNSKIEQEVIQTQLMARCMAAQGMSSSGDDAGAVHNWLACLPEIMSQQATKNGS